MTTKPKHGGARKGAGQSQKADGERTYAYNVTLDLESAAILAEYGNGNLSAGIRMAAHVVKGTATYQITKART